MIDTGNIQAIFERHAQGYHFYLHNLRTNATAEIGQRRAWPIGSCFKLAVLVAYFEALADGTLPPDSLEWETAIPPDRFRIGGGVINLLDSSVCLTDRHMLHWMLTASDGTCTDLLISKLGLARVDATLRRLAPDSHLSCDLGDMVASFRTIQGALDCKTRNWAPGEADAFIDQVARLGATHAADLANLALGAFRFGDPRPSCDDENVATPDSAHRDSASTGGHTRWRTDYKRCTRASARLLPRGMTFTTPSISYFHKSGSLGRCYFLVEAGVLLSGDGDHAIAAYGYCSAGWRLPAFVVETVGGLIGIEIARALGLDPVLNADWTPEGAALLLGDLA